MPARPPHAPAGQFRSFVRSSSQPLSQSTRPGLPPLLRKSPPRLAARLSAALLLTVAAGCGAPSAPQPPTLNLPQPARGLQATRAANTVQVTFPAPQKTTDRLPIRGPVNALLCRLTDAGPCLPAGSVEIPAAVPSRTAPPAISIEETLPPELATGPPRLLAYRVTLQNRAGKAAAPSDPVYIAAGAAPPAVAGFTVNPRRQGIALRWQPPAPLPGGTTTLRFDRVRVAGPPPPPAQPHSVPAGGKRGLDSAGDEDPADQTLEIAETGDRPSPAALDATARAGRTYRYTAQRVEHLILAGRPLELLSAVSAPVEVDYRDIFPPPVPTGLVSAADSTTRAIDLSWTPDDDPALAGYVVYRRPAPAAGGEGETPARLSPPGKPVAVPAFHDATAVPGQHYAYSVSAVDSSGNESERSAEVEDAVPAPGP